MASTSKLTEPNVTDRDEADETTFDGLKVPELRDLYFDQNSARRRFLLRTVQMSLQVQRSVIDRTLRACERELAANSNEADWTKSLAEIDELVRAGDADSITSPSDIGMLSGYWSEPGSLMGSLAKGSKGKAKAMEGVEGEDEKEEGGEESEGVEGSEFIPE
jgi:hypothetical protein